MLNYHVPQQVVQTIRGLQSTAFTGIDFDRFLSRSGAQMEARLESFWDQAARDLPLLSSEDLFEEITAGKKDPR